MRGLWTLRLLAVCSLSALRGTEAVPAPAYVATGAAAGEDMPTLAYAGAGSLQNGLYTSVYDNFGEALHGYWPLDGPWNGEELPAWRSMNAFRTNWKPSITRREVPTHTPIDLRTAYGCEWILLPGRAAISVPVGAACNPAQDHVRRALFTSPQQPTAEEPSVPDSAAPASRSTTSLPPHLGEAAQLVMPDQQAVGPMPGDGAPGAGSPRRRQVSRLGRRGASSSASAAAASASSGPCGSSAAASAASAASGSGRRPPYGYRPGVYGRRPAYGRPYPGNYYG